MRPVVQAALRIARLLLGMGCLAAFIFISIGVSPAFAGKSLYIGANDPGPGVEEFTAAQLKAGGVGAPTVVSNQGTTNAIGVAFDKQKNLWVTTLDQTLLEFTHKQLIALSKSPNPIPAINTGSSAFKDILGCVFDKQGNLWVVDAEIDGIHEITKATLKTLTGSTLNVSTAVDLSDSTDLGSPAYATFDKKGNLWMSSIGANKLVMFTPSQIATSNSALTGTVVISSTSLIGPGQMAFDKKGTLWVANTGIISDAVILKQGNILGFTKDQLTASGSPTPNIVISSATLSDNTQSLDVPWGMTFDGSGNLWVNNYTDGEFPDTNSAWITEFSKKSLKISGAPIPATELTGTARYSAQLVFGPPTK